MSKLTDREQRRRSAVGTMIDDPRRDVPKPKRPADREHKKRFCLALKPSVYKDIQSLAYAQRRSASQVIDELMENYIEENRELLDEFRRLEP